MKKLLVAAVAFAVFTLNGLDPLQLVGVIAFSAGIFAERFRAGREQITSSFIQRASAA
jgi:hypothetical protein